MALLLLGFGISVLPIASAIAQDDNTVPVPDQPPALPDPLKSGEAIEPDIRIIQREDETITEYRVNGRLYMIKVVPSIGKPYFLIDQDGDGQMESRLSDIYQDLAVPQWVFFSW